MVPVVPDVDVRSTSSDLIRSRNRHRHDRYCCHCRQIESDGNKLKRCSRCKLTIYCSRNCQIQHYKLLHKHSCKSLESISKESTGYGDFLFQVAYRSNDTPEHSADMMEQVLDAFHFEGLSLRVCFLLASLGHLKEAIWETFKNNGCIERYNSDFAIWDNLIRVEDVSSWPQAQVLTIALIKMKLVSSLRFGKEAVDLDATFRNHLTLQQDQEHQLQDLVRLAEVEQLLLAVRDCIPLKQHDVPQLFVGCPSEFFLFVQDCFLLEPGVNDLLHEFVKEEDYG